MNSCNDDFDGALLVVLVVIVTFIITFAGGYWLGSEESRELKNDFEEQNMNIIFSEVNYTIDYMNESSVDTFIINGTFNTTDDMEFIHVAEYEILHHLRQKIAEEYNVHPDHVTINHYKIDRIQVYYRSGQK